MRRFIKRLAVIVGMVGLWYGSALLADVVCRKEGIAGFETEHAAANKVIGSATTSDIKSCEVFITMQGEYLYAQSNFVSEGAVNPTKIATSSIRDLEVFIQNVYGLTKDSTEEDIARVSAAHTKHVKYYIDQTVFNASGDLGLELKGAEQLYVVFDGTPPPKPLIRLNPIRGPPYVAEYQPSLFVRVTSSGSPRDLFAKLEQRPFRSRDLRFVSLLPDSATEAAIKTSGVATIRESLAAPSKETLKELFRKNAGRVIIILGHVEDDEYVATDNTGMTTLFKLPLSELEEMATTAGCDAVMLGCNSAHAGSAIGVNKAFNPVDAVHRLDAALSAENYLGFVRALSNEDIGLVFSDTAFNQTTKRLEAQLYARETGKSEPTIHEGNLAGRIDIVQGIALAAPTGTVGSGGDDRNSSGGGGVSGGGNGGGNLSGSTILPPGAHSADTSNGGVSIYIIAAAALALIIWAVFRSRSA